MTRDLRKAGFTLVELLVVIAIIAIIASLVVPGLMNAQGKAYEVKCMANLRGLQSASFLYSQGRTKAFPIAQEENPRAHESLNVLIRSPDGSDMEPETFVCPEGEAVAATTDEVTDSGRKKFRLTEDNLSYAWVKKRTKTTKNVALASDKYYEGYSDDESDAHDGHKGTIMVISTAGEVLPIKLNDDGEAEDGKYRLTEEQLPTGLTR
jgi:prepilin-type N-terminal cleavage/methylation domain-containing protein